jgi:hypothetical protein
MSDLVGILRQCQRCQRWQSIDLFKPLGRVCNECVDTVHRPGRVFVRNVGYARGLVLTEKGKQAINEMDATAA